MLLFADELVGGFFREMPDFVSDDDLGDDFGGGTFGDIEMPNALLVGIQFIALIHSPFPLTDGYIDIITKRYKFFWSMPNRWHLS